MKAISLTLLCFVTAPVGLLPAAAAVSAPMGTVPKGSIYADGTYMGLKANAYYGNVQMQLTIKGHKIAGFRLLDYPQHTGTSIGINRQALPILVNEMIAAQSANVDIVSGATLTSEAFIQSVGSAFQQARH